MEYGTAPKTQDAYTRFMLDKFDLRDFITVFTGFQAFFGMNDASRTEFVFDSNDVDIDVVKGNERMAALIPRGTVSRIINEPKKTTIAPRWGSFSRTFPLTEQLSPIDANQLLWRNPGEAPYVSQDKTRRMRQLAIDEHREHVRRIVRLFEYLACQSILTGTMPAGGGETYDWLRDTTLTAAVGTTWLDAAATPLRDIADMTLLVRSIGKVMPDMLVMADDTSAAFFSNTSVQAYADNRRAGLVEAAESGESPPPRFQRFIDGGFVYVGKLRTEEGYQYWIFTYPGGGYDDADGDYTNYMPDGYCLLAYSGARCDRHFGPGERMPITPSEMTWYRELFGFSEMAPPMPDNIKGMRSGIVPSEAFHVDAYMPDDKKSCVLRTQAAPIFAPVHTDGFAVLTGCADAVEE